MSTSEAAGLFDGIAQAIQAIARTAWNLVWWDGFAHGLMAGGLIVLVAFTLTLFREPR